MPYQNFIFETRFSDSVRQAAAERVAAMLTARWNQINASLERRSILGNEEEYDEYEEFLNESEDQVALQGIADQDNLIKKEAALLELDAIEGQLASLGARIMRPYEHWNEEELLVERSENKYSFEG